MRSRSNTSSQNTGAPPEQEGQKPQERMSVATTGSPTFRRVTPGPTASTMPAASWPKTAGSSPPQAPSQKKMSLWQIAQAAILTRISPWPGSASSTSSIVERSAEFSAHGGAGFHGGSGI